MKANGVLPRQRNVIPKQIWDAIKRGVVRGKSYEELSSEFGVSSETIRLKSEKNEWDIPRKIVQEGERQADFELERIAKEKNLPAPTRRNWAEAATAYRNNLMNIIEPKIMEAVNMPAPKTWRDLEIADRMARKAVGLESGETTVVQTIIPIGKGDFEVERDVTP